MPPRNSRWRAEGLVPLGTFVHPLGKIGAVMMKDGERYYMTVGHDGAVGLMPAFEVERLHNAKRAALRTLKPVSPVSKGKKRGRKEER